MIEDFMKHTFDLLIEAAHDALSFIGIIVENAHGEHGEPTVIRAGHIHGNLERAIDAAERVLPLDLPRHVVEKER